MDEAELLLLNKIDLLQGDALHAQQDHLAERYPEKRVLGLSAKNGAGVREWLDILLGQSSANPDALVIDYERYAQAEAALGWLNAKGLVRADAPFAATVWTEALLSSLARLCAKREAPIAHIKAAVDVGGVMLKAGITSGEGAITWDLHEPVQTPRLDFVLNARVNATPAVLEGIVLEAVEAAKPEPGSRYYFEHFECFSPLPPKPTHRLAGKSKDDGYRRHQESRSETGVAKKSH